MVTQFYLNRYFLAMALIGSFFSIFAVGCGSREPVATAYKKALAKGDFGPDTSTPTVPDFGGEDSDSVGNSGTDDEEPIDNTTAEPDGSVAAGQSIFNRTCAGCHGAGGFPGQGPVSGASDSRILSVRNQSQHQGVSANWPNQQEAQDLAAYLDTI